MTFLNIFSSKKQKEIPKAKIIIDNREKNSLIPSILLSLNFQIEFKQLPIADYLINETAIERKTISDLKSSIINKRIFSQLLEIKQYPKHFLLVEGLQEELYNNSVLHQNAVRGFLLSAILEHQVPIIFAKDEKETAAYISVLANKKDKEFSMRPSKISLNKEEQIQFILEGFPHVGPIKAKSLLQKFKSLKNIINASEEDLQPILGKRSIDFKKLCD